MPRALLIALLLSSSIAGAQAAPPSGTDTSRVSTRLDAVTITATRTPKRLADAPAPVTVIDAATLRDRMPNTIAELFRDLPGLDITGVGTNQVRPSIRGHRGQRILLLADGLRLNNSRRQQDFGELPAIIDVNDVARVEVVRGPASVLYGTDAIGGAVNIFTAEPPWARTDGSLHGRLGYRHSAEDGQRRPSVVLEQRLGELSYRVSGMFRETDAYVAPSGRFGAIELNAPSRVNDTQVRDNALTGAVAWRPSNAHVITAKVETYRAADAGFGYVEPEALGEDGTLIRIVYPRQEVQRYSAAYRATSVGRWWADRVEMTAYRIDNDRRLHFHVNAPFGPGAPPGAGVTVDLANFTSLGTVGARAEATRILAGGHSLTYGADFFRDRSENTDTTVSVVTGFGPPQRDEDPTPQVPNARFQSGGVFAQGDLRVSSRLAVGIGARWQTVGAETRPTPGITGPDISSSDQTAVGAANALFRVTSRLSAIATVGRAFRSPNLVERFFEGPVPEGSAFQRQNADLAAETSINTDVGLRFAGQKGYAEIFGFVNTIRGGIRAEATGDTVAGLPEFRNVNVDKLRHVGVELQAGYELGLGFLVSGNYTQTATDNVLNPDDPVGDGYSSKLVGELTYRDARGRFWGAYALRHNGERDDPQIGESPIGPVLPAFTVHTLRGGVSLPSTRGLRHSVTVAVDNLTNELYAEFANAGFFRPEMGRNVIVSYVITF